MGTREIILCVVLGLAVVGTIVWLAVTGRSKKFKARDIAMIGILTAMSVVLARLLGINSPIIKLSFDFIPIVFAALYFGPAYSFLVSALADFVGAILFPSGAFNPIFTIIAGLIGLCYGLWLYRGSPLNKGLRSFFGGLFKNSAKKEMLVSGGCALVAAVFDIAVFTLIVTPVILHWYYGLAYAALYSTRIVKAVILIPLETIVVTVLDLQVIPRLKKSLGRSKKRTA